MAIQPGHHLGPYEILSAIGAGGMGEVYQGSYNDGQLRASTFELESTLFF